jgi:hypothetical protein
MFQGAFRGLTPLLEGNYGAYRARRDTAGPISGPIIMHAPVIPSLYAAFSVVHLHLPAGAGGGKKSIFREHLPWRTAHGC